MVRVELYSDEHPWRSRHIMITAACLLGATKSNCEGELRIAQEHVGRRSERT